MSLVSPEAEINYKIGSVEASGTTAEAALKRVRQDFAARIATGTPVVEADVNSFILSLTDVASTSNYDTLAGQAFGPLGANSNLTDIDAAAILAIPGATARDKQEMMVRGRRELVNKFFSNASILSREPLSTQIDNAPVDEATKAFYREQSVHVVDAKVKGLENRLKTGAITLEAAMNEARTYNPTIREAAIKMLDKSPESLNSQRKAVGDKPDILSDGKVDLNVFQTGIEEQEAFQSKDLIAKSDIQAEIASAKKTRERIVGTTATDENSLAFKMEAKRNLDLETAKSEIALKKFKENMKWVGKGISIGIPLGLLLMGGVSAIGSLKGVALWSTLGVGVIGGGVAGGYLGYALSDGGQGLDGWNNKIKKLNSAQLDAEIKSIQSSVKIDELIRNCRLNDKKSIEEVFKLTGLPLAA